MVSSNHILRRKETGLSAGRALFRMTTAGTEVCNVTVDEEPPTLGSIWLAITHHLVNSFTCLP